MGLARRGNAEVIMKAIMKAIMKEIIGLRRKRAGGVVAGFDPLERRYYNSPHPGDRADKWLDLGWELLE